MKASLSLSRAAIELARRSSPVCVRAHNTSASAPTIFFATSSVTDSFRRIVSPSEIVAFASAAAAATFRAFSASNFFTSRSNAKCLSWPGLAAG